MRELAIDIETYSGITIKAGVHKYVEDPDFQILLFAYSEDKEPIEIVDLAMGERIPEYLLNALEDPQVLKTAYNASFEMTCLQRYFQNKLDPSQWSCTMALAAQAGLPFGLDAVAKALGTSVQKDRAGKDLIKLFTVPNKKGERVLPEAHFDKWLDFKSYCCDDVATEQAVRDSLKWFTVSDFEKEVWAFDQKINNRGVTVNMDLVTQAIRIDAIITQEAIEEMQSLTDISNPRSAAQVKKFIAESTGVEVASLNKATMAEVNEIFAGTDTAVILRIRERLSRSSVKKYAAMALSVCADNRIRGLFQYYGANRTGRWAGRQVQVQNLVRNSLKDLDFARRLVMAGSLDVLKLTYDDVGIVLSNLIRTAFIPASGKQLIVSDFSAIEARAIAWLADEQWRLDVFATHGKIYEASASQMFKVPLDKVTKDLRQKGKISELALGYQGAGGALERMGALSMGLTLEELPGLVRKWRQANRKIVKFWYDVQDAVIEVLTEGDRRTLPHGLAFSVKNKNLIIQLPSGRELVYLSAKYTNDKITYMGLSQTTKQWCTQDTYGGKLVENIVQATARDILTDAMLRIEKADFPIIMHVHDEAVIEYPSDCSEIVTNIMKAPISWAKGLPLNAETFIAKYYQK